MAGRKKLAIWLHGGIGTGHFSQGFSTLERVVASLTAEYDVVVYSQHSPNSEFQHDKLKVHSPPHELRPGWRRWWSLIRQFLSDHAEQKYSGIFAFWGYPAGFIAVCLGKYLRIPALVYLLGNDTAGVRKINFGLFHRPLLRKIALWTYRRADRIIVLVDYQKNQLIKYGLKRDIDVVPWGVDPSVFFPQQKPASTELRLLQVAHLNPVKDQPMMLRTFATILKQRPARLRIVGYDSMNGEIQDMARQMQIDHSIEFLPMQEFHAMKKQYHWADILIQSSQSEGQGLAVSEAAACGVLLAGTRVGLLSDLGVKAAIVVEVGDDQALAQKILHICDNQAEWKNKTENALIWVADHPFQNTTNDLIRILKSVTADIA